MPEPGAGSGGARGGSGMGAGDRGGNGRERDDSGRIADRIGYGVDLGGVESEGHYEPGREGGWITGRTVRPGSLIETYLEDIAPSVAPVTSVSSPAYKTYPIEFEEKKHAPRVNPVSTYDGPSTEPVSTYDASSSPVSNVEGTINQPGGPMSALDLALGVPKNMADEIYRNLEFGHPFLESGVSKEETDRLIDIFAKRNVEGFPTDYSNVPKLDKALWEGFPTGSKAPWDKTIQDLNREWLLEKKFPGNFLGPSYKKAGWTDTTSIPVEQSYLQKVYDEYLHPQRVGSALLGITSDEWVQHATNPAAGNVEMDLPWNVSASQRFKQSTNKALDFLNKSNIQKNISNPFLSGAGMAQLLGTGVTGGLHQGWQGIQNMMNPNSPGHQFGALDWRSYPNLVDFFGNMYGLSRGLIGQGPTPVEGAE